jgi:hypothetical protein
MGPNNTKNLLESVIFSYLTVNLAFIAKNTKFDQETVALLCVKTKSGAHKQLAFYFQMRKQFCKHLHSSLISMIHSESLATRLQSTIHVYKML